VALSCRRRICLKPVTPLIESSFITYDDIGKPFLSYFGNIWSSF
jgi:hypothetical protein